MSDLYYYTSSVVGAIRGRLSVAINFNEIYTYGSPNGLSQIAEELIQNTINHLASSRPQYAPYIASEARRLMRKWSMSGWSSFDGEGYLLDDTPELRSWRVRERDEFAKSQGLP